ncbi:type II secretion system protein [Candidatus Gottesmanbacteria bacterium]|nr:type II secretion system protein [Candidatus Gottesmanbacteria bacterium]
MKNGFTLIEILVTVTILSLLIGGSIAGYSSFNQKQKLKSSGLTLKNTLRMAQSRSYTGEGCPAPTPFAGWNVDLANRSIYALCGYNTPTPQPTIKFYLQPNITIVAPPPPILFRSFPQGTNYTGTICLRSSEMTNTYYKLQVEASGNIIEYPVVTGCP